MPLDVSQGQFLEEVQATWSFQSYPIILHIPIYITFCSPFDQWFYRFIPPLQIAVHRSFIYDININKIIIQKLIFIIYYLPDIVLIWIALKSQHKAKSSVHIFSTF